jgi:hypothetical protein
MHLHRRLIAGQANDLCFPTAVNRRGGYEKDRKKPFNALRGNEDGCGLIPRQATGENKNQFTDGLITKADRT